MRKAYIIIKVDKKLLGVYNEIGEGLTLPFFLAEKDLSNKEIIYLIKVFFNLNALYISKLKSLLRSDTDIYLVFIKNTLLFKRKSSAESLLLMPIKDSHKLMNLDKTSRLIIESVQEYDEFEFYDN